MRRALLLGALLAAILVIAVLISFRIYRQLDEAAEVERTLVAAQQQLDQVVASQLNSETELRGFVATGRTTFLGNQFGFDPYDSKLDRFAHTAAPLAIPELPAIVARMRALHRTWEREVERPLLTRPYAPDALGRQTMGKYLADKLSDDTNLLNQLLADRLARAQGQLRDRINEALVGGVTAITIFGLIGVVFLASRAQMLAVIDREREIVETLQGAFRTDLDRLPGSRIGTAYLSADKDAAVGGDLYDVRRLDEGRGLIIVADISGKGIQAAVNTAFVKYSMRTLAFANPDPAAILQEFNRIFLATIADPTIFVVAFVAILDGRAKTLCYASAGHSGAYVRRDDSVRQLDVTGPIVGLSEAVAYENRTLGLRVGDLVVLATDGLTESRDLDGNQLDDAGAMALLQRTPLDPQECANELVGAVRRMSGGAPKDDLALLVIAIEEERSAKPGKSAA
ncbi:MAG: PP2C family protein-serine/threonine phosphatase [Vulcanimicrobiaceae bacterium]